MKCLFNKDLSLQFKNLLKKRLRDRCFPVCFVNISRKTFEHNFYFNYFYLNCKTNLKENCIPLGIYGLW